MKRIITPILFLFVAVVCLAQQPEPTKIDPDKPPHITKWKMIPQGWKALKLTAKQKEDAYNIRKNYYVKTYELEMQLEKLRAAEKQELAKILTADQKKALVGEGDPK